ncbi:caspase family protein [Streptomyces sp. NBC_01808]|uniref:caspase family protein n=1 Tax=Streptomyces sp. NBC_01808 TaxID=2975947 RepID=UPI002DD89A9E|nr:caspase family protein [Streptomyces sp. NBC_01808]WSA39761.1 caspase family protein [Streptomyces sp. NBC_01808]
MFFPDADKSQAVLIGVSRHRHLDNLPTVRNNLTALSSVLMSDSSWSLPENSHCRVVRDPENVDDVVHAVRYAARAASDSLFVYYAGHGLIDPRNGDLSLSLVKSRSQEPYTAVLYEYLRREILSSRASRRIVVLDCCFGARAFPAMGDPTGHLLEQAQVHGTYLISAAGETREALADDGEGFTAFTGELVRLCRQGISDGPELLDLDTIFRHIEAEMRAKSRPIPRQRIADHAGRLALVRNPAYRQGPPAASPSAEGEKETEGARSSPSEPESAPGGNGRSPDGESSAEPAEAAPGRVGCGHGLLIFFALLLVGVLGAYFFIRPEGDPTPGLDYSNGDRPTENHEMCRPPQSGGGCQAAGWRWNIPASEKIRTTLRPDDAGTDRVLGGNLRLEADCDATVKWTVTADTRPVEHGTIVSEDTHYFTESLPPDVEKIEITAQRTDTETCDGRLYWVDAGLTS